MINLWTIKIEVITIDQEILGGTPVFQGTRVPIETLFDHLESGISIDAFLDDFPSVTKEGGPLNVMLLLSLREKGQR